VKWVRTYTGDEFYTLSCGRSIVWDPRHCEPVYLAGYSYLPLFEQMTTDTIVIEWDLALSREDRARFEGHCQAAPDLVHVAPYPHYEYKPDGWDHGWVHRNDDLLTGSITEGEPDCKFFGFGLVYFPLRIVQAFLDDIALPPGELAARRGEQLAGLLAEKSVTDVAFSAWHWAALARRVPVHWDVRPVHLNYEV
jgi:hypothetical protein